ncbi:MAG: oligosaccharide flippase family protein [Cyclobacteriaceae bacterium]|nr:oligosaccharide flippase family protein [Cyclobacteriaceae bacterium]
MLKVLIKYLNRYNLKEFSFLGSSTILFQLSKVLVELYIAKLVGPLIWGKWYFFNLIIAYRSLVSLGVDNALNREIPKLKASDSSRLISDYQSVGYSFIGLSSIVSMIVFIGIIFFYDFNDSLYIAIATAFLFCVLQYYSYSNILLKSQFRFDMVSLGQIIFTFIFPILSISGAYFFDLYGYIYGYIISLIISMIVLYFYNKNMLTFRFRIRFDEIFKLIKIGFPIMAVGISYTFLNTADRWIIGLFIGAEALGYYSLSIIVFGALLLLPQVVSQIYYPKMIYEFNKNNDITQMKRLLHAQYKKVLYLSIPLLILSNISMTFIVERYLPEFLPGLLPLRIVSLAVLSLPISSGYGNLLNIIDKQKVYLSFIVIAVLLNLLFNYLVVVFGYGIAGVALTTVLVFFLFNISLNYLGRHYLRKL